jgi:thiosulfate/3-mercaptopyruvate sulfurtransferase
MFVELALAAVLAAEYAHPEQLVDTAWVAAHATDADVRVVDMRNGGYAAGHVPGAVALSMLELRDTGNPPTFVPRTPAFEALMGTLGISNTTRVVLYDERGGAYAARFWWALHYFGHENVALMDGGWTKWRAEQRPMSPEMPTVPPSRFTARPQPHWVANMKEIVAAMNQPSIKIVDARTAGEISSGFVPSAIQVDADELLEPGRLTFKSADDLERIYRSRGILPSHEVIAYCLVGMRASLDLFALRLIGYDKLRNYYAGWAEWVERRDLPVETRDRTGR